MNLVLEALDICKRHGFRLRVITNGIQLPHYLEILKRSIGVLDGVTVTLDGARFSHDKVRRTLDGEGTYDRVVSSSKAAMRNGIDVTVRLNVSQDNIDMLRHSNWRHSDFKYEIHRVEYPLYEKAVSFWQLLELCLNGYISLTELAVNQVGYFYQIFEEDQAHYPLFGDCLSGSVLLFSPEGLSMIVTKPVPIRFHWVWLRMIPVHILKVLKDTLAAEPFRWKSPVQSALPLLFAEAPVA